MRRGIRGGSATASAFTPSTVTAVREWWISSDGVSVVSGTPDEAASVLGQKQGWLMQAPSAAQRPLYQADGANFGGNDVLYNVAADSRYVIYDAGSDLFAVTDRLLLLVYGRIRAYPPSGVQIGLELADSGDIQRHRIQANSGGPRSLVWTSAGSDQVSNASTTTAGWFRSRYDGADHTMESPGQPEASSAHTGDYNAAMQSVGTGNSASGPADMSYAAIVICNASISATDETAVREYIEAQFA